MTDLQTLQQTYQQYQQMNLNLNMQRGQPSDADFDLSNDLLGILNNTNTHTTSGTDLRNYPGGIRGLPEARELFASILNIHPDEILIGNNSSLALMADVLMWALLKGLVLSASPWVRERPKMIVTVPGYDRHFSLLEGLGFELVPVAMTAQGPDMDAVETLVASDASIKGIFFVPTYSNPTGDSISGEFARRLVAVNAAAVDFTIFADDAYRVHHLTDDYRPAVNLLNLSKEAGHPERVIVFASTSKITFAGAGIGFMGGSEKSMAYLSKLFSLTSIGPNKVEQYRHVKFLQAYPGGVDGLMREHAALIVPKFNAVYEVLSQELQGTNLARWTQPKGGYFISLDTHYPVASRVVELANNAGVSLTPAGATYPGGVDPNNSNIRLAPTRPDEADIRQAMKVIATCIKLASAEHVNART